MRGRQTIKAAKSRAATLRAKTLYGWYATNPNGHRFGAFFGPGRGI